MSADIGIEKISLGTFVFNGFKKDNLKQVLNVQLLKKTLWYYHFRAEATL